MQVLSLESVFVYIKLQNKEEKNFCVMYTLKRPSRNSVTTASRNARFLSFLVSSCRSQLFAEGELTIGEYSPIFTEAEANNCFSIITQVIIREKQEPSENVCQFCLFVSNCHASMNRDAQSADHMLNRNHMVNR